jgi:hypothetical protein
MLEGRPSSNISHVPCPWCAGRLGRRLRHGEHVDLFARAASARPPCTSLTSAASHHDDVGVRRCVDAALHGGQPAAAFSATRRPARERGSGMRGRLGTGRAHTPALLGEGGGPSRVGAQANKLSQRLTMDPTHPR